MAPLTPEEKERAEKDRIAFIHRYYNYPPEGWDAHWEKMEKDGGPGGWGKATDYSKAIIRLFPAGTRIYTYSREEWLLEDDRWVIGEDHGEDGQGRDVFVALCPGAYSSEEDARDWLALKRWLTNGGQGETPEIIKTWREVGKISW